ncbi:MAG TPA: hypothetical protein VNB90_11460 [Cytophagaceae bacterium]|nr:hypothetical protein [Cytophagaceae bacterium]
MNILLIAFAFFVLLTFGSRTLGSRALKQLTLEEKTKAAALFSLNRNLYLTAALIGFALLYFFALQYRLMPFPFALGTYVVLTSIFIGINIYFTNQKLITHNFPQPYIRLFLASDLVYLIGLMIFFGIIYSANLYQHLLGA